MLMIDERFICVEIFPYNERDITVTVIVSNFGRSHTINYNMVVVRDVTFYCLVITPHDAE